MRIGQVVDDDVEGINDAQGQTYSHKHVAKILLFA